MRCKLFIFMLILSMTATAQFNLKRLLDNGRNALYFEDYVLSMQYFNKVIELRPYDYQAYHLRGIAKLELEDYEGAESDLTKAVECNPFMPALYYARGFARKRMKSYLTAENDFRKALEFSPENFDYELNLIDVQERQKKYDEALNGINSLLGRKSTRKNRMYDALLLEKIQVELEKGDTLRADSTAEQAINENPSNSDFYSARGLTQLIMGNDSTAYDLYTRATELGSKNLSTYTNLGILNYRRKRYKEALDNYDTAIGIDPTDEQSRFNRAMLRIEVGDLNNATTDLDTLLLINPDKDEAYYERGIVALQTRDYRKAMDDFKHLMNKYPGFIPAYFSHAQAAEGLGMKRQAAIDRYRASRIEEDATNGNAARYNKINHKADIKKDVRDATALADRFNSETRSSHTDKTRGHIQNENNARGLKPMYAISPYAASDAIRKGGKVYLRTIEALSRIMGMRMEMTNNEVGLSEEIINLHFSEIKRISKDIRHESNTARQKEMMTARGINYMTVQNLDSAIIDLTAATEGNAGTETASISHYALGICLLKKAEISKSDGNDPKATNYLIWQSLSNFEKAMKETELRYYSCYNEGCAYYLAGDYKNAELRYSEAIAADGTQGDAYYNRAITRLRNTTQSYTPERKDEIKQDLSKAGELGVYQAYGIKIK